MLKNVKMKDYKNKKSYTCAICKTAEINPAFDNIEINNIDLNNNCWNNGTIDKISFGFGSVHDMDEYYIAICDDCLEKLKQEDLAIDVKNYKEKNISIFDETLENSIEKYWFNL